ncbi:hypothetical protein FPCIR_2727 [Fusarium pseudocircinatum]|uniref:PD-(D/E)XK nuclease-like domain-containing protein n=1 Tax=Fusarium pseudocircinatum TaxID=56676 RepID=A0A8H5UUM2_9HYPO|nr:hypothetical protein FPCIR_2727 [Fusarium pseudocircinatum]
MPEPLEVLLGNIDLASSGIGVLPSSQRSIYGEFKLTRQPILSKILFSDERDNLGQAPAPETVYTTASIITEYHVTSASKNVDFCMYLDPKQDESAQVSETIDALKNILPLGMFNHANLAPISDNPIAVSIETKKTGEGWKNAKLQMEVWMAAH